MNMEEQLVHAARVAVKLEEAIYQKYKTMSGGVGTDYLNRSRMLLANLGDSKNPNLKINVLSNVLTPDFLAKCNTTDLASDELKRLREKMAKENLAAARTDI